MINPENKNEMNAGTMLRLHLHFSPKAYERLCEIRNETEVASGVLVTRNALRFYDWYINEESQGNIVQLETVKDRVFNKPDMQTMIQGTHTVDIYFHTSALTFLNELRRNSEAISNEELIWNALDKYDQYLNQRLPGNIIKVRTRDGNIKNVELLSK